MLFISANLIIPMKQIKLTHYCSPGPGGQNVNKVATGVLLRFDLTELDVDSETKDLLLAKLKNKLTNDNQIIIRAHRFRTQAQNKADALARLQGMLKVALTPIKPRKKTKPSKSSKVAWKESKKMTAEKKKLRTKIES